MNLRFLSLLLCGLLLVGCTNNEEVLSEIETLKTQVEQLQDGQEQLSQNLEKLVPGIKDIAVKFNKEWSSEIQSIGANLKKIEQKQKEQGETIDEIAMDWGLDTEFDDEVEDYRTKLEKNEDCFWLKDDINENEYAKAVYFSPKAETCVYHFEKPNKNGILSELRDVFTGYIYESYNGSKDVSEYETHLTQVHQYK